MRNRLVALFGIKYEPDWLVEQLKENLRPFVDDFAILDCRDRDELWIHEGDYRVLLREEARKKKADWVLITSPDERLEDGAGDVIRPLIDNNHDRKIYNFKLRELYMPNKYRVDGIWGQKTRGRLFPLLPDNKHAYQKIQCPSVPQNEEYENVYLDVNIYHLKHIEPENRELRARVFKQLDPHNEFQGIGYDYLNEDYGAVLEDIPAGRGYKPKYKKYKFEVPEKYL